MLVIVTPFFFLSHIHSYPSSHIIMSKAIFFLFLYVYIYIDLMCLNVYVDDYIYLMNYK